MHATLQLWAILGVTTILLSLGRVHSQAAAPVVPYGCSYSNGIYSCDWNWCFPLTGDGFDPPPQQLDIYNVDGAITDVSFVDFSLVNTTLFDSNYDASLSITCLMGGGSLELDVTSFTHMSFYKSVHIYNCNFDNIPISAFISLGSLNYFGISGGNILAAAPHALAGMNVERDFTSVDPKGELSLTNVAFTSGEFQTDFVEDQTDISVLTLDNVMISSIPNDLFSDMDRVTSLNLDNNNFTSLSRGVFSGMKALSLLSMRGVNWECSCPKLWWMEYSTKHGIRITSETICASPSSYTGRRAATFHDAICTSGLNCDGGNLPAMNLADVTCLTYLQLFIYIMAIVSFFGLLVLGYFWFKTRRQMAQGGGGPEAGNRRSSRVANQGRAKPPGIKGGW